LATTTAFVVERTPRWSQRQTVQYGRRADPAESRTRWLRGRLSRGLAAENC